MTRLAPHAVLSTHRFELAEWNGIDLKGEVAEEARAHGKRDEEQQLHEHVGCKAHTVLGKAHVPPRVFDDAHEAIRLLLLRGKKLCSLLFLYIQRDEAGDLFALAVPP